MNLIPNKFADVFLMEPKVFGDDRGYFYEAFNQRVFIQLTGLQVPFVQDNQSRSARGVLRGLHYQTQHTQGKLIRVLQGEIFDVIVDVRRSSPTLGQHTTFTLNSQNKNILYVPPGYAHGFYVCSEYAEVLYKTTDYYAPEFERTLLWNDPQLNIAWPTSLQAPLLSAKDLQGQTLQNLELL